MRAVVGGTVTSVEPWSYTDKKTQQQVNMQSVFILAGGRQVEKVSVPLDLGVPDVGDEHFYVADVNISSRQSKDGSRTFTDLSIWARSIAQNPFVDRDEHPTAQSTQLAAVPAAEDAWADQTTA